MHAYSLYPIHINAFLSRSFHTSFPFFHSLEIDRTTSSIFFFFDLFDRDLSEKIFPMELWTSLTGIQHLTMVQNPFFQIGFLEFTMVDSDYYELQWTYTHDIPSFSGRSFEFPSIPPFLRTPLWTTNTDYHWIATHESLEYSILFQWHRLPKSTCWICHRLSSHGLHGSIYRVDTKEISTESIPAFFICRSCCQSNPSRGFFLIE